MLRNYLTTAIRTIKKYRFFSLINILGLALAMTVSMLLVMLLADQLTYDRHNTNGSLIYRINTIGVDEKGIEIKAQENASSPMPVGPELKEHYTGIAEVVRFRSGFGSNWEGFLSEQTNAPITGFFTDENVLHVFQYELEYGDPSTALVDPYSVVLTRKAANKLFRVANPVGEAISVGDQGMYKVTGVLKEAKNKSHLVFEGLASMSTVGSLEQLGKLEKISNNWTNCWETWTYIQLEPGQKASDSQRSLAQIYSKHIAGISTPGVYKIKFLLQPLFEITPGAFINNPIGPQLPWSLVYALGGLALLILITTCINFTNLSLARSLNRAREIGVRKATGAGRWQIFIQFISESVVTALLSLSVALIIISFLKPLVLQLNFANILQWNLATNLQVYIIFILFAIGVGILAGIFPAVVLSGFKPVDVLKSMVNMKAFSRIRLRKALLVSQFTIALFFILTVITLNNQLQLFTNQNHGFNMENNMVIKLKNTNAVNLKNELKKYPNMKAVSVASHLPAAGTSNGGGYKRKADDTDFSAYAYFHVDDEYALNMELTIIAGEFFSADDATSNQNFVIINEAALEALRFNTARDAIGEVIIQQRDSSEKIIKGVVANYNHRTLTHKIEPLALLYGLSHASVIQVSYDGDADKARENIQKAWAAVNPDLKIDYTELKIEINKFYDLLFGDLARLLSFISLLAVVLSCLGLLGMAAYSTETRMKEISIRKILGSTNSGLLFLLSKEFLSILVIAIGIGVPLAYLINSFWLELIAYHTTIGAGTIGRGILLLITFALLTIGSQTWRALFIKPVKHLRND